MGKKIMVNWQKLHNLGNNTEKYAEEFEKIRNNLETTIQSISTCWQGIEANEYIQNTTNYLESLKQDTKYLYEISNYFTRSALRYNNGVDNGISNVKNLEKNYIIEEENFLTNMEGGKIYE